ncbi:hypothetical protein ACFE04_018592 [Oxalis oulophora]
MASFLMLNSPVLHSPSHMIHFQTPSLLSSSTMRRSLPPRNTRHKIMISCKYDNFLDLKPERDQDELLNFDLSWYNRSAQSLFDVIIIGTGPAGLRLAEQVSRRGIDVCCVDPSPLSVWPNNYGTWVDEFEALGLEDCFDFTWHRSAIYIDDDKTRYIDRPYGRISRKKLKTKLLAKCVSTKVTFHKALVSKVEHNDSESSIVCDDGSEIKARLIVDASGHASTFTEYNVTRNHGYQIAHGILAEVESHPFDLDKVVLMDWRDSHLGDSNLRCPTLLYAMPLDSTLIFLEETSLVARPVFSYDDLKRRMAARLRHLGINVKRVIEEEKRFIPMGGPLPKIPQQVVAFGVTSGIVDPTSGYSVARSMALAPILANAIADSFDSKGSGRQLYEQTWNSLWPIEGKLTREFYSFAMETLLQLDLYETRRFFDTFFELEPHYMQGFLSSSLSVKELGLMGLSLFRVASNRTRFDFVTKTPAPFLNMILNLSSEII